MVSLDSLPISEKARLARGPVIDMHDEEFEEMLAKSDRDRHFPTSWFTATAVSGVATVCLLLGRNHMVKFGEDAFGFSDFNMEWLQLRILWPTVLSSVFALTNLALAGYFKNAIPAPLKFLNVLALALGSYAIMSSLYQTLLAQDSTMDCPLGREDGELFIHCVGWNQEYRHYLGIYLLSAAIHGVVCACLCIIQFVATFLATVRILTSRL